MKMLGAQVLAQGPPPRRRECPVVTHPRSKGGFESEAFSPSGGSFARNPPSDPNVDIPYQGARPDPRRVPVLILMLREIELEPVSDGTRPTNRVNEEETGSTPQVRRHPPGPMSPSREARFM